MTRLRLGTSVELGYGQTSARSHRIVMGWMLENMLRSITNIRF